MRRSGYVLGHALSVMVILQLVLAIVLDSLMQWWDFRTAPRYVTAIWLPVASLFPVLLIAITFYVFHQSTQRTPREPHAQSQINSWSLFVIAVGLFAGLQMDYVPYAVVPWIVWAHGYEVREWTRSKLSQDGSELFIKSRLAYYGIVSLVIVGLILRGANVVALGHSIDENFHLLKVLESRGGQAFDYFRGRVVTASVEVSFALLQPETYDQVIAYARLPGIILGALTVVPLYFAGKLMSRSTGIIAATIWAVNPLSIEMSRYVREYTYFAFIASTVLAVGLTILVRYQTNRLGQYVAVSALSLTLVSYASRDSLSTFRANAALVSLTFIVIVGLRIVSWVRRLPGEAKAPLFAVAALLVLALAPYLWPRQENLLQFSSERTGLRLWTYYETGFGLVEARSHFALVLLLLVIMAAYRAAPAVSGVITGLAVSTAIGFAGLVYLWDRWEGIHYTTFILPHVVLLAGVAVSCLLTLCVALANSMASRLNVPKSAGGVMLLLAVPILLGPLRTAEMVKTVVDPRQSFISQLDVRPWVSAVSELQAPPEVVFGTFWARASPALSGSPVGIFEAYRPSDSNRHQQLVSAMSTYTRGIIVIDRERIGWSKSLPNENFTITVSDLAGDRGAVCATYKPGFVDFYVWSWGYESPHDCEGAVHLNEWLSVHD